ncbi:hypothetical protein CPB83DRAFT_775169 [Crepidotus variabilis]|uniref:SH3 domain-containing protein n=1 Tax=Crepidotus variabilis TaxID=179855 RepID=A0A9P6E6N3_9AGAR|nr:hypothetical protein CPB83DRAFT_775169 [Crepidotus variabilis]
MTDEEPIPLETSLDRFAHLRQPDGDPFNGRSSRDFCNSFWGPSDAGPSVLFTRMRGGSKTTNELHQFWSARRTIEEEYAAKLAKLSRVPVGVDEIGELRNSLDALRVETQRQAQDHDRLALNFGAVLECATADFLHIQTEHQQQVQMPLESRAEQKRIHELRVETAKGKYEGNYSQVQALNRQLGSDHLPVHEYRKVQQRLARIKQFMIANKLDHSLFTKTSKEFSQAWEAEWKDFCDSCQDLEIDRLNLMNDVMWAYANEISSVCVSDAQSIERIRDVIDQLVPDNDVRNFAEEYGTGNSFSMPANFNPSEDSVEQPTKPPIIHFIHNQCVSKPQYHLGQSNEDSPAILLSAPTVEIDSTEPQSPPIGQTPPTSAPATGRSLHQNSDVISPSSSSTSSRSLPRPPGKALFYGKNRLFSTFFITVINLLIPVKALYDYKATDDTEFDFQVGDIIAVMSTPEDGWWSGELLDEARREESRHIFPSNFVSLL